MRTREEARKKVPGRKKSTRRGALLRSVKKRRTRGLPFSRSTKKESGKKGKSLQTEIASLFEKRRKKASPYRPLSTSLEEERREGGAQKEARRIPRLTPVRRE